MPLEDLEAPDFVEPEPGLSRAEDEEMFRVRAHRLGRFIHGEISSEVTQTSKISPRHINSKKLAPSTAKTTRNTNREDSVLTEKTTQTAKKLKKPRKPREPSVKKPIKTKTTRRKRLPLDQVPDTVMPALNAVTLTQRVELVGPKLAAHGIAFGRTGSRTQPHAIRHIVNMHDAGREAKTHDTESTTTESLLGLAGSIPSDLGLEEVYQLHDVSYESRDIELESDFDGSSDWDEKPILTDLQTNTAPGSSAQETPNSRTHAQTDTRPGSTQPYADGDDILCGSHDTSSLLACAPGDASIEITSVKPLQEIIYVGEDSREMGKSRESETEKSRDSYLLAAGSDDDVSCSSPPPTFNYNNYKSFLTIVESDIIHVSDSDSEVEYSCAKARSSFDTRNTQQQEVFQTLDNTYEGSDPDLQIQKTLLDNPHVDHETTPVRTMRLTGKAKKPNVDENGVPIHRMINTLDGPTRVYRMCSSDSDETDSWTPGKSREIMLRETEQRDDHIAISSSPVLSCSTPRAPTKSLLHSPGGLSSPEGSSSSGASSIISMTVGTGKPIHAPIPYVQSRFFSTKPKASESASDVIGEAGSRVTRLVREPGEVDLTELSRYTSENSETELFVPESPEAALRQDPSQFEVSELDDFNSIVMPGESTSRESSPSVIAGRLDDNADSSVIEVQVSEEMSNHKQYGSSPTTKSRSPRREGKRAKNVTSTRKKKGKQSEDSGLTDNPMALIPPSTQATASMAAELLEKGEVDKIKISELTEFIMSAPEAREMWLKMLTFEPIPLSQLMEFTKRHGLKISKVLTIAWCDLHGVTWTSRDEEKEADEDSEG